MKKYKSTLIVLFLSGIPGIILWANTYVNPIIETMNECYDKQNKIGVELAKCMGGILKNKKNLNQYYVKIYDDNPSKSIPSNFKLTIYNQSGYQFVCTGVAAEHIVFKSCHSDKNQELSPTQLMSIIGPMTQ